MKIVKGIVRQAALELYDILYYDRHDDPMLWPLAWTLFGIDRVTEWQANNDYEGCFLALTENLIVFKDADTEGRGYLIRLYTLWSKGAFADESGKNLLEVSRNDKGEWSFGISEETKPMIAEKMGISPILQDYIIKSIFDHQRITNDIREACEAMQINSTDSKGKNMTLKDSRREVAAKYLTDEQRAAIGAVGVALTDEDGNKLRDADILTNIIVRWKHLTDEQRNSIARTFADNNKEEEVA